MRIKKELILTTKEKDQFEAFGNLIHDICDNVGRTTTCSSDCVFADFCGHDAAYYFLELVAQEFSSDCDVNTEFED